MGNEVDNLLKRARDMDPEEFCTDAFVITSEKGIIDEKVPLNVRYQLAYEFLQKRLHKHRGGSGASPPEEVDYYDVLGIDESATQEEIEDAYKHRSDSLKPDVLEKKLRDEGLTEKEIKTRLENAERALNHVENAHKVLGNEERRDHYDERLRSKRQDEWNKTLDQKQKSSIGTKTSSVNHGENWELLGVSPNPNQIELRTAYLSQVREYNPDRYLESLGKELKELTPEELREYNIGQEKWSNINRAYYEEVNEQSLKLERNEIKVKRLQSPTPTESTQNIIITTTPTVPVSQTTEEALKKTEKFRETVENTGPITITPEETAELKSAGVVSYTTPEELSANATIATTQLLPMGIEANKFSEAVDIAVENNILTPKRAGSLQEAAFILEAEQSSNPELSKRLITGNREPNVTITTLIVPPSKPPQRNQIVLQSQNGYFKPLVQDALGKGFDVIKGKAEKEIAGFLGKEGITLSKTAVKKIATDSLKKVGKELIKQGSKIAAKAGLTAAAQAAGSILPIIGNIIAFIATKVLPRLVKFVTKAFRGLVKFITGKDDLKSQLGVLSLYGLGMSIIMGSTVGAVVSGGSFILFTGAGSVLATLTGAFTALISLVSTAIFVISTPVIISIFAFFFLVVFTIMIINNSAFVVPYGGFDRPPPGSIAQNLYIGVTKTAQTSSPSRSPDSYQKYENSNLPLVVNYTVSIKALQGGLTNVKIGYNCDAQKNPPPNPECPKPDPIIPPPPGNEILAGQTYTFSYAQTYNSPTYTNSLVTDTIIVTADVSGSSAQTGSAVASICIGDCPEDCPFGWPVSSGYLTQGPDTSGPNTSHGSVEAVDIAVTNDLALPVYTTHKGIVEWINSDCEGIVVHVRSVCNGVPFVSRYSHLGSRSIGPGTIVNRGDQLGNIDNTGTCTTGTHLHYEFRGLIMEPPWIPEIIPSSDCCSACGASYTPRCNTTIP